MAHEPSALEVYWVSGSPYAWRVLLALEVKRLSYASRLLGASKGDLKKPEYLKLNPRGKVPTLKDGDFVLGESLAIMAYLDRKHPQPGIFGRADREAARIWHGDAICAADIAIYPFMKSLLRASAKEQAKPLELGFLPLEARYPCLDAWMRRVEQIPGYERTVPPHWWQ